MRTTVDLPPAVHRQAKALAESRHQSLSSVIADLTARGLAQLGEPALITRDERTGLPTLSIGRRVTSQEVAALLDDD